MEQLRKTNAIRESNTAWSYTTYELPEHPPADVQAIPVEPLFSNDSIRAGFVRKVFSVLLLQLGVTFAFVTLMIFNSKLEDALKDNTAATIMAIILAVAALISMGVILAKRSVTKAVPYNYLLLSVITIGSSFPIGVLCAHIEYKLPVLYITAFLSAMSLSLTAFSLQTKIRFRKLWAILISTVSILIVGIILQFSVPRSYIEAESYINPDSFYGILIAAGVVTFLLGCLWIFIVDCIMKDERMDEEEYIFAAFALFISVILIFLILLACFASEGKGCQGGGGGHCYPMYFGGCYCGGSRREDEENPTTNQE